MAGRRDFSIGLDCWAGLRGQRLVDSIITRSVSFEVALFKTSGDQRGENQGNYHNPKRQRGIYGDIGKTGQLNPSITFRVVMAANAQLQKASARDVECMTPTN